MTILYILLAFIVKHFVCDFPLQAFPYMYTNKGTYGHRGGLLHSAIHVVGTFVALIWFVKDPMIVLACSMFDGIVHYHIDWCKMNINKFYGWKPDNSEKFWVALGVDQMLHSLTYWCIMLYLITEHIV